MRVHSLNCGTFAPPIAGSIVCHVLLCETSEGLVLVDTGLGLADYADPKSRMGPVRALLRPTSGDGDTALRQIEARGHSASDVSHIVVTHLDFDHIGGLSDFPDAQVHTTADEHAAAVTAPDFRDKQRYRPAQWAHGPRFVLHEGRGDLWQHDLTGHEVLPGITLVPMPGHSRGHAAVAVQSSGPRGEELLVHAGDAAFDASSYADTSPSGTPLAKTRTMRIFESTVGRDRRAIKANHQILRRLNDTAGVTVFPAHDERILDDMMDT